MTIKGIKIGDETTKLSLFEDNMTCFLHDKASHTSLCGILEIILDHILILS